MRFEKLILAPLEVTRFAGQVVLWATEKAVPPEPNYRIPASIQYFSTPEVEE